MSLAEKMLLTLTLLLASLWTAIAPPWNLGVTQRAAAFEVGNCSMVRDGMNEARVKDVMRSKARVVSEEDVRGPGASAWVYDDERCIVHFIDGKVIAIEQE